MRLKIDGNKAYIGTTVCIAAIAINHFVVRVPGFHAAPFDGPWLFEIMLLAIAGYGGRSAIKKIEKLLARAGSSL